MHAGLFDEVALFLTWLNLGIKLKLDQSRESRGEFVCFGHLTFYMKIRLLHPGFFSFIWILSNLCFSKCRSKASIWDFQKTFKFRPSLLIYTRRIFVFIRNIIQMLFAFSFRGWVMCQLIEMIFREWPLRIILDKNKHYLTTSHFDFWLMIMSLVGLQILNFWWLRTYTRSNLGVI